MGRKNVGKKGGGKRQISNIKKNNLKRHKLVKAGKLKPKSSPRFVEGGHLKGKANAKKAILLKPEELEERERIRKEEAKQWVRKGNKNLLKIFKNDFKKSCSLAVLGMSLSSRCSCTRLFLTDEFVLKQLLI